MVHFIPVTVFFLTLTYFNMNTFILCMKKAEPENTFFFYDENFVLSTRLITNIFTTIYK